MPAMFKYLGWFIKKEWHKYILIMVLSILFTYALTVPPKYIGLAVDAVTNNTLTRAKAFEYVGMILASSAAIYIFAVIKNYYTGQLSHRLYYQIRNRFLRNVFRQDGDFFEEYYTGDLISRATGDSDAIARVSTFIFFHLFDAVSALVITFIMLVRLDFKMTLLSILPLPIIFVVVLVLRPKIMRNWREVRREVSHLNNMVMESVTHVKLIRGFVKEGEDERKLAEKAEKVFATERQAVFMQAVFRPTFNMTTVISQGIALGYGAYLIMNQLGFSVGALVTFNLYLAMFSQPLFRLGNQITTLAQSTISFERVEEIIRHQPTIVDAADAAELEKIETIEFKDFSFRYPKDNFNTLEGINLRINSGETIGIVGKTGSGKTTLVRQLLRQFPISEGELEINGRDVSSYKKESIRRNIAYVPQEHRLFSRTVLENLLLGVGERTDLSVEEAVELADFKKDLDFLSNGLETIVGESGVTLSGGQKQRLSIARAYLKNADVLIMDDALSAVDGITEINILRNLVSLRKGKINIIVSHRLSVVEDADKIIVLDGGKILEAGTHAELMANRGWYHEQYLAQQMEADDEE